MKNRFLIVLTVVLGLSLSSSQSRAQSSNENAEAIAGAMGRAFENLARIGWDHSHWLSREVTMASPEKVHISTVFQRFNDRNEPIAMYQSLYLVTLVDGHWGTQARSSLAP